MESIQSKLIKLMFRIVTLKNKVDIDADKLKRHYEIRQPSLSHEPSKKIQKNFDISKEFLNDYCYYVMKPLKNSGTKHIMYIHGGGFVNEITFFHWNFLAKLVNSLQGTITIPIYPLAPKHYYQEVFEMIVPIYKQVISKVKSEDVVIMGDSAGGSISLSLAELLDKKNIPQPGNIILISPCLDISLNNPEIRQIEKLDPMLSVPKLLKALKWYRNGEDSTNYLLSPIYGDIDGLGKIHLFIGTHDILYPDAKKSKNIADEKKIKINYYEYPSMMHVWPLLFFPESKKATKQIIDIIKSS